MRHFNDTSLKSRILQFGRGELFDLDVIDIPTRHINMRKNECFLQTWPGKDAIIGGGRHREPFLFWIFA